MAKVMSARDVIKQLLKEQGGRFSATLNINLEPGSSDDVFKWFLASVLFGARISQSTAIKTYQEFEKRGVVTAHDIITTGWDGLVKILDAGGYVRYDYRTATKLLDIAEELIKKYDGDLNRLHAASRDAADLEAKLLAFKGVGPVTVEIFLRELRDIWKKADPLPGDLVVAAARRLGFTDFEGTDERERKKILLDLERIWYREQLPYQFSDFEAALVRLGASLKRRKRPEVLKS